MSDLATKPQDAAPIPYLMEMLDHYYENDKSPVAPQLDLVDGDTGLKPYIVYLLGICCQHL